MQSDDDDGDAGVAAPHTLDTVAAGPPRLHAAGDRSNGFAIDRRRSPSPPERPASFPLVDYEDDDEDEDGGGPAAGVPVRGKVVFRARQGSRMADSMQ